MEEQQIEGLVWVGPQQRLVMMMMMHVNDADVPRYADASSHKSSYIPTLVELGVKKEEKVQYVVDEIRRGKKRGRERGAWQPNYRILILCLEY
jgi:hypothetical protein